MYIKYLNPYDIVFKAQILAQYFDTTGRYTIFRIGINEVSDSKKDEYNWLAIGNLELFSEILYNKLYQTREQKDTYLLLDDALYFVAGVPEQDVFMAVKDIHKSRTDKIPCFIRTDPNSINPLYIVSVAPYMNPSAISVNSFEQLQVLRNLLASVKCDILEDNLMSLD